MATRSYVTPSAYDPTDAEFTIATIDGNPYLQMGALGREDAALFRSLIDGYAGFFLNGKRVAAVRITERYDPTNGVQLESLPTLTTGGEYHVRFTQARPGRDGSNRRTGGMQPFSDDGMMGRRYGPMIPFNRYNRPRMLPYTGDGMTGKPSGEPMLGRLPKKREGAQDMLSRLDGMPDAVADYIWAKISDRVPEGTTLRDAEQTFDLIRARLDGFIEGYTEAYTTTEKSKLSGIEDRATRDQSGIEILGLLLGLNANQRDSLRNGINAQVQGSYAPGSTISATVANVLAALKGFSDDQDAEARTALDVMQNSRDALIELVDGSVGNIEVAQLISSGVRALTFGDGYLWYVYSNRLQKVNMATGEDTEVTTLSSGGVSYITFGDGHIWFIRPQVNRYDLRKINITTGVETQVTQIQGSGAAVLSTASLIAFGDGHIWYYYRHGGRFYLQKVNLTTNVDTRVATVVSGVISLTFGGGHLWYVYLSGIMRLHKINAVTGVDTEVAQFASSSQLRYLTFGNGYVWYIDKLANPDRLHKVNAVTGVDTLVAPLASNSVQYSAFGNGSIWYIDRSGSLNALYKTETVPINVGDLLGVLSVDQPKARRAIQALGRDITLSSGSSGTARANIVIEVSAEGDISVAQTSKTIASGSTWIGIDFAGGVI